MRQWGTEGRIANGATIENEKPVCRPPFVIQVDDELRSGFIGGKGNDYTRVELQVKILRPPSGRAEGAGACAITVSLSILDLYQPRMTKGLS